MHYKLGYLRPAYVEAAKETAKTVEAAKVPVVTEGTPLSVMLETLEIDPDEFEALNIDETPKTEKAETKVDPFDSEKA